MEKKRIIIISVLFLVAAGSAYLLEAYISGKPPFSGRYGQKAGRALFDYPEKAKVDLFFADDQNYLRAEQRTVPHPPDPAVFGRVIIESLISGPRGELVRTIPEKTALKAFYVAKDGASYADFTEAISKNHPGGSSSELVTIYSIVNSVVMNIPEIKSVKILIEGKESGTLAGHIDLGSPFSADFSYAR
jgi:hypothetical protein